MAIVDTMNESSFCDRIKRIRPGNFSWAGLQALYEYYDELSEDTGKDIEFDPISICCEWTEYDDLKDLRLAYKDIEDIEDMEQHYIEIDGGSYLVQEG